MKNKEGGVPHHGFIFHARALTFVNPCMMAKTKVYPTFSFLAHLLILRHKPSPLSITLKIILCGPATDAEKNRMVFLYSY